MLSIGDVLADALELVNAAVPAADGVIRPLLPADRSVRPKHLVLSDFDSGVIEQRHHMSLLHLTRALRNELQKAAADQLLARASEIPAVGFIDEGQSRIGCVAA